MNLPVVPPPPPPNANGLASILGIKPELTGLYYRGATLKLDGYTFNRCRFDNCVLQTATGDFELVHSIVDNCRLQYFDPALRIIKLFTTPYNFGPEWGGLVADKHDDGTISIRKV